MARLNLEEKLWTDPLFFALEMKLGKYMATGAIVVLFRVAQNFWKQGNPIPEDVYRSMGFPDELEKCGWVTKVSGGLKVVGSEKHFSWLRQKVVSGRSGGIASGIARSSKINKLTEAARSGEQAGAKRLEPSLLSSLNTEENTHHKKPSEARTPPVSALVAIWNETCGTLPRVVGIPEKRKRVALARLREKPELDYWRDIFSRISKSGFCRGEGSRGWRADFDFAIRPDTHVKVLEGQWGCRPLTKKDTGITVADFLREDT